MGHTSRCIPVIEHIHSLGHRVTFAGNEWQRQYISETFRGLATVHLHGYNVHYGAGARSFMPTILLQVPRLLKIMRQEHQWLMSFTHLKRFDGIISDNRYGLYHSSIPTVIMTHQLRPITGLGNIADNLLATYHYRRLGKFTSCWVVDVPGTPNLAGKLSHPHELPPFTSYLGLLSQLAATKHVGEEKHLLILLSGPEPQRAILASILWKQALQYPGKVVFVEGKEGVKIPGRLPPNISWYGRVAKKDLLPLVHGAEVVICRSGYSSIMDLVALNKKAILIPTPGQTEQEYLARHLHKEGIFYSVPQKGFNLATSLSEAAGFGSRELSLERSFCLHKNVIDRWIEGL